MGFTRARRSCGLVVIAIGVLAFSGAAAGETVTFGDALIVATAPSATTAVELVSLDNGAMANVELDVPAGYTLTPSEPVGTKIADVLGVNKTGDIGQGTLTAADPATYTDAASQACDPQAHAAVWTLALTGLGAPVTVPWFVDAAPTGGYATRVCLPASSFGGTTAAPALGAFVLTFDRSALQAPTAAGTFMWRALIATFGSDGLTPNPTADLEYQAFVPLPTTISMKGTYNAKTKFATVTGKLTIAGKPANGYTIDVGTAGTRNGKVTDVGTAATDAHGDFDYPVLLTKSAYVFATPEASTPPCTSPTTNACFATEFPVATATAHVVVHKAVKKKPKKRKH